VAKVGRNQKCPCASGLKYKRCCGSFVTKQRAQEERVRRAKILSTQHTATERIRQSQQGLGKPIISSEFEGRRLVTVGNELHWSTSWKTFPDFLDDYIKRKLGAEWGSAEIAKPIKERHPLLQWYDTYWLYKNSLKVVAGDLREGIVTGVVASYMGVAYGLYLLQHNAELQSRLIARLRDVGNFQGAYYELIVASILLRAGFELVLEDETNGATKHCEFAALSPSTGKKYWVEAKMRGVAGQLGRTKRDGGSEQHPEGRIIRHLSGAFGKPADSDRMIFLDVNADPNTENATTAWVDPAIKKISQFERQLLKATDNAYVFITNFSFHRQLLEPAHVSVAVLAHGLGIEDFAKQGNFALRELFRRRRKHIDAHKVIEAAISYAEFPISFDGSLPSHPEGTSKPRIMVGDSYLFTESEDDEHGVYGEITSVAVNSATKSVMIAVNTPDRGNVLLKSDLSDAEYADYQRFSSEYFGDLTRSRRDKGDDVELMEWVLEGIRGTSREKLLLWMRVDPKNFQEKSDDEIAEIYAENIAMQIIQNRKAPLNKPEAKS
jgi:hypothetical protein